MRIPHAYEAKGRFGSKQEGYLRGNLVAGYTHFHFASNPKLVEHWIDACLKQKNIRLNSEYYLTS